ncbi:pyrroline-5-carboxylate reductase [Saccharomycopsis crataegensis]|uniref:Pyrroline-5-carboxylate reductase n=1 Tax=Saccharomycopsis crataegensis TaxID=43959 RepID=A0AAV5QRG5_9ASCO|nr:pyrroline-5-carboxylate reductase [Saccharomycopsis crataegensis]
MPLSDNKYTVSILGCGTMGTAVLNSILSNEDTSIIPTKIITLTKSARSKEALKEKFGNKIHTDIDTKEAILQSEVVVLGLKPFLCESVLETLKDEIKGKLIISLAAGWTIEQLSSYSSKVARVMTNTPAKFGYGMAAIAVSDEVSANQHNELDTVNKLIGNVGKSIVIPESKMDSATSLIGSGPAFVLLMIESMIDSGIKMGFSYEESRKSVLQVIEGTCKMTEATGLHPAVLKTQVCTPGGTTINGLAKMEEKGVRSGIVQGIEEAKNVAASLGKKK